ncbi:MAG: hypothetical protein KatS3mg102_1285 [Planctomycetota bacterium]|nr:MAG: hypothetical protein KatS3mg102_1285 [Planctomycetota bacterium]
MAAMRRGGRARAAAAPLLVLLCLGVGCGGGSANPSGTTPGLLVAFAVTDQQLGLSGGNPALLVFFADPQGVASGGFELATSTGGGSFTVVAGLQPQQIGGAQLFALQPVPATLTFVRVEAAASAGGRVVSNAIRFDPAVQPTSLLGHDPNGATVPTTPQLRWDDSGQPRHAVFVVEGNTLAGLRVLLTMPAEGANPTETLDLAQPLPPAGGVEFRPSLVPLNGGGTQHFWTVLGLDASGATLADSGGAFVPFTTQ